VFTEPVAKTLAWTEASLRAFRELATHPPSGVQMSPAMAVGELPIDDELPPQVMLIPDLRPPTPPNFPRATPAAFAPPCP